MNNPYEVLGVSQNASEEEIKTEEAAAVPAAQQDPVHGGQLLAEGTLVVQTAAIQVEVITMPCVRPLTGVIL